MKPKKAVHQHVSHWTAYTIVCIIGVIIIHVFIISPMESRDLMEKVMKSHEYLGIDVKQEATMAELEEFTPQMQQMIVENTLVKSLAERKFGVIEELRGYKQGIMNIASGDAINTASGDDSTTISIASKDSHHDTDISVIQKDEHVQYITTNISKIIMKDNPLQMIKPDVMSWYEKCSLDAAMAKHCYTTGYEGGKSYQAAIDVNNITGDYYGDQYKNCWWLSDQGISDRENNYLPLDTDTVMMMIESICR
jgi:hypothetical protein